LLAIIANAMGLPEMAFSDEPTSNKDQKVPPEAPENPFPDRHPSPDLEGGVEWLNATGPISVKDLRGKIVLLDFWTFCCINCMHVLPDLAYLEKKFPNELVVIGVHSAKFDNERESGNIRKAILRYEIQHPVVNDARMTIWRKFGVNSWPSLVVIDPEGQYCGHVSGEGNRELLQNVIERLVAYHKSKGTLDETPVHFALERNKAKETPLRFPGKLLVDEANNRLFISDSNHNRLVICGLDGTLQNVIGSGEIGRKDGGYSDAEFDHPQGMALVADRLYVADTENHLLRIVDLKGKMVSTLAGVGAQSRMRTSGGILSETALNSPWDLTVVDGVLYVAMAGPHQVWAHQIGSKTIHQYAGSGREDIINGNLDHAALAQPSGIVTDGSNLYVVDSEGSAVRKITTNPRNDFTKPHGTVTTIAGTHDLPRGKSLFEFGDVDGMGNKARFQHPLGIVLQGEELYVADSYNHKIKRIELNSREVSTWLGAGTPGTELVPLQLSEPAGLAIANGKMYVADTNNHRIVVVEMNSKLAHELPIIGLQPPRSAGSRAINAKSDSDAVISLDQMELKPGKGINFEILFDLPEGYKLNELLPVSYRLGIEGEATLIDSDHLNTKNEVTVLEKNAKFTVPTATQSGQATLLLSLVYGYCRNGDGGLCKLGTSTWKIPITLQQGAIAESVKLKAIAK
jgi:thiol-disulfide isomerase/thioredoxin